MILIYRLVESRGKITTYSKTTVLTQPLCFFFFSLYKRLEEWLYLDMIKNGGMMFNIIVILG